MIYGLAISWLTNSSKDLFICWIINTPRTLTTTAEWHIYSFFPQKCKEDVAIYFSTMNLIFFMSTCPQLLPQWVVWARGAESKGLPLYSDFSCFCLVHAFLVIVHSFTALPPSFTWQRQLLGFWPPRVLVAVAGAGEKAVMEMHLALPQKECRLSVLSLMSCCLGGEVCLDCWGTSGLVSLTGA